MRTLPLLVALVCSVQTIASTRTPTDEMWASNGDIYRSIVAHPFVRGMVDGSLPRETFARYLLQDAFYLREFAVALRTAAAKAPRKEWSALLERHARESLEEELRLHQTVLTEYGLPPEDLERVEPSPDAFAYTTFIVATANRGTFGEAMSALLPCYWIYRELGRDLKAQGSPDSSYRKWIDAYSSPDYSRSVDEVLAIVDRVAMDAGPEERRRMTELFRRGFQYEWMFWEAAFRPRPWPP